MARNDHVSRQIMRLSMKFQGCSSLEQDATRGLFFITEFTQCLITLLSVNALLCLNYYSGYANTPHCYFVRTLPILLYVYLLDFKIVITIFNVMNPLLGPKMGFIYMSMSWLFRTSLIVTNVLRNEEAHFASRYAFPSLRCLLYHLTN